MYPVLTFLRSRYAGSSDVFVKTYRTVGLCNIREILFRTIEIRDDKVYSQLNNAILSVAYANLEAKGIDQCHRVVLESESNDTNMV